MKTFYITTPIYYANGEPHLGSLYTTLIADSVTRYKRQRGFETYFLTGTDEHGINIERVAKEKGRTPREHVDLIVAEFQRMFALFEFDTKSGGYDHFIRTTDAYHYEGVSHLWRQVAKSKTPKGQDCIYKGFYEGWFCAPCAAYKTEDEYVKPDSPGGTPLCPVHERPLDRISEESYFFRLSDYTDALLDLYKSRPDFIRPEARRNEVISFVSSGLQDLSISRPKSSVSWGIPVPDDPSHTIYVWFDALSNYITAIGYGNEERQKSVGFEKFWPAVHLVGKDILRFHVVYWPAFLMAAGIEQPQMIYAHGMWLASDGRKMSKTLGTTINLNILHNHFSNDAIRYFCLREMVFGQDGKFSYDILIDRANSDLAKGLGNLISRTLTMIHRYCDGKIPSQTIPEEKYLLAKRAGIDPDAMAFAKILEHARDQYLQNFDDYSFNRALEVAWSIIARVDKMISDAKPWELAKDEAQKHTLEAVLYRSAETLRWLCILLHPVMLGATRQVWSYLGQEKDLSSIDPATISWGELREGTAIGTVQAIFPQIDKEKIMTEIDKEKKQLEEPVQAKAETKKEEAEASVNLIEIDDFIKVEIRVGQILTAERVPKSDKLLKFTVDVGEATPRQILAGIAEHYEPETLINRKIAVVTNLKPRKLRGLESQGMVLAASVGTGDKPALATFSDDVPNGAKLK
jgi:methionyl-tRNA synthetase